MKRIRAVVIGVLVVLVMGVSGRGETGLPESGLRGAYAVPWRDGAKVIRVQTLGKHFALVTVSPARVIDSITVTERDGRGGFLREYSVFLVGDEFGMATAGEIKPTREWWDRMLGIERGAPRERIQAPRFPGADQRSPAGGWR